MKRLLLISATLIALTGCADRERLNCPRTKNQIMTRTTEFTIVTTTIPAPEGRC